MTTLLSIVNTSPGTEGISLANVIWDGNILGTHRHENVRRVELDFDVKRLRESGRQYFPYIGIWKYHASKLSLSKKCGRATCTESHRLVCWIARIVFKKLGIILGSDP